MSQVQHFFDKTTNTLSYVVYDAETRDAILIDPVMDYDPASGKIQFTSCQLLKKFVEEARLKVHWILETHAHADHLSGAQVLKKWWPQAKTGIGERICLVQKTFQNLFNLSESEFHADGRQFDRLFKDQEILQAGSLKFKVIFTPGHTPACASYLIDQRLFTGDALFMPDLGTGRCDFPAGSAEDLYRSIHGRIYELPEQIEIFTGHDYPPATRGLRYSCSLGEQKNSNIQLRKETSLEEYVKFRTERDKTLSAPRLLFPSLFVNIDGGRLPKEEAPGKRYLKSPLFVTEAF